MRNYIQKGDTVDALFPVAVAAGGGVLIGPGLFGFPPNDTAANAIAPLSVVGVYEHPKAAVAIAAGAKLYWDNAAKLLTNVAAGNSYVGSAPVGAVVGAATVVIRLNGNTV
jgi:predicted RecA/RadA family phage recombinase